MDTPQAQSEGGGGWLGAGVEFGRGALALWCADGPYSGVFYSITFLHY